MSGATFALSKRGIVEIDKANPFFGVYDEFIINFEDDSAVRYFGPDNEVLIAKRFSGIGAGCFRNLSHVSRVRFEAGSRVSWFRAYAFFPVLDCYHFRFLRRLRQLAKDVSSSAANLGEFHLKVPAEFQFSAMEHFGCVRR
jgi:hypothetical protein